MAIYVELASTLVTQFDEIHKGIAGAMSDKMNICTINDW